MNINIRMLVPEMSNACGILAGLALILSVLKAFGAVSWSWFAVTLPITFPVIFFAAVGAITFGASAGVAFVFLAWAGLTRPDPEGET